MRVPWMIAFPGVIDDILRGNIHVFLAAMIVLALRYPAAWAFGILTKVTPGIGLVWHAVRREWRALAFAAGTTGVIVSVSYVAAPDLWAEWIGLLTENAGATARIQVIPLPLAIRLPIAVVVIAVGGLTSRAWLLPIGVMLGLPNVWTSSTALLAAVPALWKWRRQP
jgi:Glycosyltransferase family 87